MEQRSALTSEQFASFGELLKYLRRRAGLTQRELAQAVGYSDAEISRFEKNQRVPDAAMLRARFFPALGLAREPALAAQLLTLAARRAPGKPAAAAPADNLPLPLTSFIGRQTELATVERLIAAERLLTLVGPAGTGKTRLALEAGTAQRGVWPDGVWWFELAALTDPALVAQTVAAGLEVREQPQQPLLASLVAQLRARQALLILDNCEHLVAACAELARAVLQACPRLRIMATSREALGLAGETLFQVPPLSLPAPAGRHPKTAALLNAEAVRLFVDRVAAGRPDFQLTAANAAAVAEICRQLDGLPLALELAAARARVLSVEEIAGRLGNRFQLLTAGHRTALPRHQTLTALLDWGHNLLGDAERTLFRRLAVFRGGWTLAAAEAVCAGESVAPANVLNLLTGLVDKSLVLTSAQGAATRYSFLETIRVYAEAKLADSGEAEALRRRHARFYIERAEAESLAFLRAERAAALAWWAPEFDNLRAALDWALEGEADLGLWAVGKLNWQWFMIGYMSEAYRRMRRAAALAEAKGVPLIQAGAVLNSGLLAWIAGDYAAAQTHYTESARLFQELGLSARSGVALILAGRAQAALIGPRAETLALLQAGVARIRADAQPGRSAGTINLYGGVVWALGDLEQAWAIEQESIALCRELGNDWEASIGLGYAAYIALDRGDLKLAEALFTDSLRLMRPFGTPWNIAWRLDGFAGLSAAHGQWDRAARLFGAAQAMLDAIGACLDPIDRHGYAERVARVRAHLGGPAFAQAWDEGQALTLEQAVAYALGESAA